MTRSQVRRAGTFLVVGAFAVLGGARSAQAITIAPNTFNELTQCTAGNAGDLTHPCVLTGGPYGIISGNLDPIADPIDVFEFHWVTAGTFEAEYSYGVAEANIRLSLFDLALNLVPGGGPAFESITVPALPVGNYLLRVESLLEDPPFIITILGPGSTGGNPITGITATTTVPEPGTLLLLGAGLIVIARQRGMERRPQRS